jgi:beta-glucosidase
MERVLRALITSSAIALCLVVIAPSQAQASETATNPQGNEQELNQRADALIAEMTPAEKAAQVQTIFVIPAPGRENVGVDQAKQGTGSFLFVSDPVESNRIQRAAVEQSRLGIPVLFGFDVVHGLKSVFPVPIALSASWDPSLARDVQAAAAKEARSVGISWTFAPMVDIARDPRWGRIVEGSGEDPFLGGAMAAAQVRGFQGDKLGSPDHVIAGPKHFAGYGAAMGGRDYDEVNLSDEELWNVYFPPFQAAIKAGAGNIMAAYMPVNGIPASANKWLLTDVLRSSFGFKGWVVSDSRSVKSLQTHGVAADQTEAAIRAINAGLDMEMAMDDPAFSNLPKAMAEGKVSQARLDEAVKRVLMAKLRLGLFEKPYVDEARSKAVLGSAEHLDLARRSAERSAVLLRNDGNVLPLNRASINSIAVIGALADSPRDALGPWVFPPAEPVMQSLLDGIRNKAGSSITVRYEVGVTVPKRLYPSPTVRLDAQFTRPAPSSDDGGIAAAVAAAQTSDVAIVVIGEAQDMIGEAASRSTLKLPGRQQDLLDAVVATGKPVVAVLMNGRPLDLGETKAPAILDMWYPGSRGGRCCRQPSVRRCSTRRETAVYMATECGSGANGLFPSYHPRARKIYRTVLERAGGSGMALWLRTNLRCVCFWPTLSRSPVDHAQSNGRCQHRGHQPG